jgi:hypothetical protein
MMKQKDFIEKSVIAGIFILIFSGFSCKQHMKKDLIVTIDRQFKDFFYADSNGISGADGIFSIPLANGSSLFLLGDCFLGKVENGTRDTDTKMLRNAIVLIDKNKTEAKAVYKGTYNDPVTFMEPVNEPGDLTYRWYWPGHGFVKDDTIYIFALSLYNVPSIPVRSENTGEELKEVDTLLADMFGFRLSHIDLLSFTLPDFKHIETHKVDINYPVSLIDFGNCVMVDDGYVYFYGTKNEPYMSKIHVARVPLNSRTFYNNWEYSTGTGWDKNIEKSMPIDVDISVSEQFSIFKYHKKYILLTQERAGADIFTYVSDFPDKEFHNKKFIYHTTESDSDTTKRIFTYNALAHAQYIEDNKLLVSYCVNSMRARDFFENVENYRARFLRVPMKMILAEPNGK